jgi:hypothetical protein
VPRPRRDAQGRPKEYSASYLQKLQQLARREEALAAPAAPCVLRHCCKQGGPAGCLAAIPAYLVNSLRDRMRTADMTTKLQYARELLECEGGQAHHIL